MLRFNTPSRRPRGAHRSACAGLCVPAQAEVQNTHGRLRRRRRHRRSLAQRRTWRVPRFRWCLLCVLGCCGGGTDASKSAPQPSRSACTLTKPAPIRSSGCGERVRSWRRRLGSDCHAREPIAPAPRDARIHSARCARRTTHGTDARSGIGASAAGAAASQAARSRTGSLVARQRRARRARREHRWSVAAGTTGRHAGRGRSSAGGARRRGIDAGEEGRRAAQEAASESRPKG